VTWRHREFATVIAATAMQQAGIGASYIKNIINDRVASFLSRTDLPEHAAGSS
jgi:ABC-2 type transport system permease protein